MIVISKFFDKSLVKINVNKKSLVFGAWISVRIIHHSTF